jgi:hypothetical protein
VIEETLTSDGQIISIVVRHDYHREGIEFFTPGNFSQQLGYMNRPRNYRIDPHVHNEVKRHILLTQEVLIVKSGKLRVDLYDQNKKYIESKILYTGDVILLASGGHGFEMLEPTEVIEVKQGPYSSDEDKEHFEGIHSEPVRIKPER